LKIVEKYLHQDQIDLSTALATEKFQ
jgi:hypothetical protein